MNAVTATISHVFPSLSKILLLLIFLPWTASSQADEAEQYWPQWRGPLHNGVAPHSDPPTTWSETENIRLKVEIPGRGLASPIVWGDRIFLLTAEPADATAYEASQKAAADKLEKQEWPPSVEPVKQAFMVLAVSRNDGRIVWRRTAVERVPHESHYLDASWASASPVTDGERLFAHFGSNGLYSYDVTGKLRWSVDLGDMTTRRGFGEGSSPALHGDTLIVNWDHEGDSFIVALDADTGEQRWRRERPDEVTSWATPLVVEVGERTQVVVPATGRSRGYDLETGEELWSATGMTVNTIPTPVHRDGMVYLTSGYRGTVMQAISLAKAKGPINDTEAMAWTFDRHTPYVPSPVLIEDRICFIKHLRNVFTCLDADSGEVIYTEKRLDGITNVYASPVVAGGRIYIFAKDGRSIVLDAGPEYKVLATNVLDDPVNASPAVADSEIYVRSDHYLYAISSLGGDRSGTATDEPAGTQAGSKETRAGAKD
ncbi:MAG: PQQ-binding-like beta-propeller repeat protein [Acidobacteriota bacterium]